MNAKIGFSIKSFDEYEWPVDVQVPTINSNNEGEFETHRFTGVFRHMSMLETNEVFTALQVKVDALKDSGSDELSGLRASEMIANYQIDLYEKIWVGWKNLTDLDGNKLTVNADNRRSLLQQRIVRDAVMAAHRASQNGETLRVKNSPSLPEAGQAVGES